MSPQVYRFVAETTALERGKQRLKPLGMLIKDGEVSGHGARMCAPRRVKSTYKRTFAAETCLLSDD